MTFRVQFHAGAVDDPAGKEGLNTLTAMTIGEGGTKTLTYREVVDRLYPMAASFQAQPDREVTTFIGVLFSLPFPLPLDGGGGEGRG